MSGLLAIMLRWGSGCFDLIDSICKPIATMLFTAIDTVDSVFRRLAGIKSTADVQAGTKDFVDQLIESPAVKNIMISLMLFGVCVLVLMVILAIIRNVYKDDSKVTISSIFGQAIKAVLGFILIPAFCLVGVKFSNVILQTIDGATQAGGQISSSFTYGIYSACMEDDDSDTNPYKVYADPYTDQGDDYRANQQALMIFCQYLNNKFTEAGYVSNVIEDGNIDTAGEIQVFYANMATAIFNNFPDILKKDAPKIFLRLQEYMGGWWIFTDNLVYFNQYDKEDNTDGYHYYLYDESGASIEIDEEKLAGFYTRITNMFGFYYYDSDGMRHDTTSWNIKKKNSIWNNNNVLTIFKVNEDLNYFNALLASILIFMALWKLCFGMAKRIVQIVILYILSPIALAMYPWDNGSAFGGWKKDFVGYTIGAYGAVAAMNLTVQLMPIVTNLNIIPERPVVNAFAKLVMYIVLAQGMASLVSTLSGWIGGKDLLKEGGDTSKQAMAPVAKVAGVALGAVAMGAGVGMAAIRKKRTINKAGTSTFEDSKESFLQDRRSEAESTERANLTLNSRGKAKSTSQIARDLGMTRARGESASAFADRVNAEVESRVSGAGEHAYNDSLNIASAEAFATTQKEDAIIQAKRDLKNVGGLAATKKMAGKLGTSVLGLMGDASGLDMQKVWTDNYKGVIPEYDKVQKSTGIGIVGNAGNDAVTLSNVMQAGRVGSRLVGNTAIAATLGSDARAALNELENALKASLEQLRKEVSAERGHNVTMSELKSILKNPNKAQSAAEAKAVNTYIRETRGADKEMAILQNTIDATVAINGGFAGADEGKLRDLSRKGAADGFKDAKAYLLGEVQKSVERSGKRWTGDMASEIEKQLDKYFKNNFKPNRD
ncbi:MAG: hypothetical protein ACLRFG_01540 [Clostridia bacterium]